MDRTKIASFIQELRKEKGLTQAELGDLLNISFQAISKWENGENLPDVQSLENLSIIFKVTIDEILKGEKNKNKPIKTTDFSIANKDSKKSETLKFNLSHLIIDGTFLLLCIAIFFIDFIKIPGRLDDGNRVYFLIDGWDFIFANNILSINIQLFLIPLIFVCFDGLSFLIKSDKALLTLFLIKQSIRFLFAFLLIILFYIPLIPYLLSGSWIYAILYFVSLVASCFIQNKMINEHLINFFNRLKAAKPINLLLSFITCILTFILAMIPFTIVKDYNSNYINYSYYSGPEVFFLLIPLIDLILEFSLVFIKNSKRRNIIIIITMALPFIFSITVLLYFVIQALIKDMQCSIRVFLLPILMIVYGIVTLIIKIKRLKNMK